MATYEIFNSRFCFHDAGGELVQLFMYKIEGTRYTPSVTLKLFLIQSGYQINIVLLSTILKPNIARVFRFFVARVKFNGLIVLQ